MRRAALAVLCAVVLAGCGAAGATSSTPDLGAVQGHGLQGLVLRPREPAPALVLHNYTGPRPVSLAQFRGRAVLVTFVYTHCPDVCPLIISNLATAQRELGARARHLQILAVTVDPRRDTPAVIGPYLRARDAAGRMDYLLGSRAALRRIYRAWKVSVQFGHDAQVNGHSAIVYGITASGRLAVVYPSTVSAAQLVHDVPLLASA